MKRILRAGPSAKHKSIAAALSVATANDLVLVGPGTYTRATGERFPLYVPPGVSLFGAGQGATIIDGQGNLEWSWRPFRTDQSLIVLRNGSTLAHVTVQNSGGCGVSVSPGACCTVTDNVIRDNGLHGLLVSGAEDCVVRRNTFADNGKSGVSIPIYRPQPVRPGEGIFIVCMNGHKNRVLISGNDIDGSEDHESLTVITDPDDNDATATVRILDNRLTRARVAILLCASFGGSRNKVAVDLVNNDVRGAACAVIACAAYPVVRREAVGNELTLSARGNSLRDSHLGVQLIGAFGPARDNRVEAEVLDNVLINIEGAALRAIGALGNLEAAATANTVSVRLHANTVSGVKGRSLVLDGAGMEVANGVLVAQNVVDAQLGDNVWSPLVDKEPIFVRQGPPGNEARIAEGWTSADEDKGVPMWWE